MGEKLDRNEPFKPLTCNREDVPPLELVRAKRATAGDRDRLLLQVFDDFVPAIGESFGQVREVLDQLYERQRDLQDWLRRPWWRRIFRRPPPLQPLTMPHASKQQAVEHGADQAPAQAAG